MTHLVFSHGNSFPAGTYNVLFEHLRARGFEVSAVDRFGHDPRYPVTSNWPHLVQQLADFAQEQVQRAGAPVYLAGHSLGGHLVLRAVAESDLPPDLRADLAAWLQTLERQRYAPAGNGGAAASLATLAREFQQMAWPRPERPAPT